MNKTHTSVPIKMSSLFASTPALQETASLFINEKIATARTKVCIEYMLYIYIIVTHKKQISAISRQFQNTKYF